MAAVHIDKVEHTHLIAFVFQQTADVTDDFALWVEYYKRCVAPVSYTHLDAQLDNLDDKELSVIEATVIGLCKAKEPEE